MLAGMTPTDYASIFFTFNLELLKTATSSDIEVAVLDYDATEK
jgi:hypothetical protein